MKVHSFFSAIIFAALLVMVSASTDAATAFWHGQGETANWSDADNWDDDSTVDGETYVPQDGDSLRWFPSDAGNLNSNNDLDGLSIAGISLQGGPSSGVVLNGNQISLAGTIDGYGNSAIINLPIQAEGIVAIEDGTPLTINGVISEDASSRDLRLNSDTINLSGANTISGKAHLGINGTPTVYINTLDNIGIAQSLGTGTTIQFSHNDNSGSIVYTGGATSTDKQFELGRAGSYTGSATFLNNGTGAVTWTGAQAGTSNGDTSRTFTLGGTNADDNEWQSVFRNFGANDILSVDKSGDGKWILSGDNTYTGATSVTAGTLLINGDQSGATGAVTVDAGATLGGTGTVGGAATVSGILSPGTSAGTLTFADGLDVSGAETLLFELGTTSDLVRVSGGDLEIGTLGFSDFDFTALGNFGAGDYTLFESSSLLGTLDDGDQTGLIDGLDGTLSITDDNVVLVVIPEPAAGILFLASFLLAIGGRRRK